MQAGAMPGLRQAYTQSMNVVIRKELRLYASSLRKAASASSAISTAEPDMGMAHKRVSLHLPFHPLPLATAFLSCTVACVLNLVCMSSSVTTDACSAG